MRTNYNALKNIFIHSAITNIFMEQRVKALNKGAIIQGELAYWFWRYVFPKNVTKKALTNHLLKSGFDNLTTIEIIDALNSVKNIVKELLLDAKANI